MRQSERRLPRRAAGALGRCLRGQRENGEVHGKLNLKDLKDLKIQESSKIRQPTESKWVEYVKHQNQIPKAPTLVALFTWTCSCLIAVRRCDHKIANTCKVASFSQAAVQCDSGGLTHYSGREFFDPHLRPLNAHNAPPRAIMQHHHSDIT